jgi:hypothetical protein
MAMVLLLRMKNHTGDEVSLHSELIDLCGVGMMEIISTVIQNRDFLLAEFKVRL